MKKIIWIHIMTGFAYYLLFIHFQYDKPVHLKPQEIHNNNFNNSLRKLTMNRLFKEKKRLYSFVGNVIACIALFTINYLSFSRIYHYSCFSWLFSFEFLCGAMKRCMELTRAEIHNFIRLAYTLLPYDWNHLYWKFTAASWKRNYDQFGFHFLQN